MNKLLSRILILPFLFIAASCGTKSGNENTLILMKTSMGDIKLRLYDNTPIHRDNFLKLVNSGFYEGISFHRVINHFMIQAGDPLTRTIPIASTADSLNTYTIPSEFRSEYFHKRGVLAAAREGNDVNPEMRSSGTHFYIVQGTVLNDSLLTVAENRINSGIRQAKFNLLYKETGDSLRKAGSAAGDPEIQALATDKMYTFFETHPAYRIPEDQKTVYKTIGGVPRLDQNYTVFGDVLEGMDVVDRIAGVQTDASDKPLTDIKILKIKIL